MKERIIAEWFNWVEQILPTKKQWAAAQDDYEKRRLDSFCADSTARWTASFINSMS